MPPARRIYATRKNLTSTHDSDRTTNPSQPPINLLPSSLSAPVPQPGPSRSPIIHDHLPNHVIPPKPITRQIKTRSMTSGNTTGPTVAFGGTVPKRITRPPPAKKSYQSNATNRVVANTDNIKTSVVGPVPRSETFKEADDTQLKAEQQSTSQQAPSDIDDHASVGRRPLRGTDDGLKENIPQANHNRVPASSHHRTRSCSTVNSSLSRSTPPVEDDPHVLQPFRRFELDPSNPQPLAQHVLTDASSKPCTTSKSTAHPVLSSASGREQPLQHSFNKAAIPYTKPLDKPLIPFNKRLFEEIDDSTNKNLFSFLDVKGKSKQQVPKLATRQVFKSSQPLTSQRSGTSTKPDQVPPQKVRRKLATSIRAQATQPFRKKAKLNSKSPDPKRISIASRRILPNTQSQPIQSTSTTPIQPQQSVSEMKQSTPCPDAVDLPKRSPPADTTDVNQPQPPQLDLGHTITSNSAIPLHSHEIMRPSEASETSRHQDAPPTAVYASPHKRPFAGTSISPRPVIIKSKGSEGESEDNTSADAIDFLSPRKKTKPTPISDNTLPTNEESNVPSDQVSSAMKNTQKEEDKGDAPGSVHSSTAPLVPMPSPGIIDLSTETLSDQSTPPTPLSNGSTEPKSQSTQSNPSMSTLSASSPKDTPASVPEPVSTPPDSESNQPLKPSSKPPSQTVQPMRSSPIKEATMPTSILVSPSRAQKSSQNEQTQKTTNPFQQPPSKPALSSMIPTRPSMLPRRTFKTGLGLGSSGSLSVPISLDAIVENSPAKPLVRDALSSSSLNLSRGHNIPPKVIFTGGIKAKAAEFLNRQNSFLKSHTQDPSPRTEDPPSVDEVKEQEADALTGFDNAEDGASEAEEEAGTGDQSSNSINANQSMESSSSGNSTTSSGNMSQDTQDRLSKLQAMLTKMNLPRGFEHDARRTASSSRMNQATGNFTEYEVPLKDDTSETVVRPGRQLRARTVSGSSNISGAPNHTGNRLKNRASTSGSRQQHGNQSSSNPRRESNILPSANIPLQTAGEGDGVSADHTRSLNVSGKSGPSRRLAEDRLRKVLPLKDVVALVDVRTAEGDDAGKVFVEMLKGLGAKVHARPTCPLTHIVFKAGKQTTIDRWLIHPKPKPSLVGIGWVVRCREVLGRASETPYLIDINSTTAPVPDHPVNLDASVGPSTTAGASNRRKSMEPKALALLGPGLQLNSHQIDRDRSILSQSCAGKPVVDQNQSRHLAQSLDRARRKSLQYLPKVGSPLASKVFVPQEEEEEVKKD